MHALVLTTPVSSFFNQKPNPHALGHLDAFPRGGDLGKQAPVAGKRVRELHVNVPQGQHVERFLVLPDESFFLMISIL